MLTDGSAGSANSKSEAKPAAGPLAPLPKKTSVHDPTTTVQIQPARHRPEIPKPTWHPPWKLMRVMSGHEGWVRTLAVDPSNEWFASSGNDRLIKIWDLASGTLKLSL